MMRYVLVLFACCLPALLSAEQAPQPKESMTFSMIKPRAVKEGHVGEILSILEKAGFHIKALRLRQLTSQEASQFYIEHKDKPFYPDLVKMMSSGPIVTMVLSKEDAIQALRTCIGPTNPKKAPAGTVRALFGVDVTENAIHASDSPASAEREISFFFSPAEIVK